MQLAVLWLIIASILVNQSYGGAVSNTTIAQPPGPLEPRIEGDTIAKQQDFPYLVQVIKRINDDEIKACVGAVLTPTIIVTTGHCVHGYNPENFVVYVGILDLIPSNQLPLRVKYIYLHGDYNSVAYFNDIALLQLWEPLTLDGTKIAAIDIPRTTPVKPGSCCIVSGWGKVDQVGPVSAHLKYEFVSTQLKDDCSKDLNYAVLPRQLCAGHKEEGKDSCQIDSGGPLVCGGLLHGLLSSGLTCAQEKTPRIYTEVYGYRNWLQTKITQAGGQFPVTFYNSTLKPQCSNGNLSSSISFMVILISVLMNVFH